MHLDAYQRTLRSKDKTRSQEQSPITAHHKYLEFTLTDKDVAHQGGWQAEDYDQDISNGQVDYKIICDCSHPRCSQDNGNYKTVAD